MTKYIVRYFVLFYSVLYFFVYIFLFIVFILFFRCNARFYKATDPATTQSFAFVSKPVVYLHSSDYGHQYTLSMAEIHTKIQDFTRRGSGWVIGKIEFVDLYISKYNPIRGRTHCPLPRELASRKAIINVKNKDDKCFMWSILAALHPMQDHAERVSKYKEFKAS